MPRSYIKRLSPDVIGAVPWTNPSGLYEIYGFPRDLPGGGVIGIGELGGGWVPSDVASFFASTGLTPPSIADVSVGGGANNGDPNDPASLEVALDIQIAASVYAWCTGKPAALRMYWAPNAASAIEAATSQALSDGCDVMSWSWGEDEALTGRAACQSMEALAIQAAEAGMVITAAAGDNDSSDGGPNPANVDSPASCPHIIACGGTRKDHQRRRNSGTVRRAPETVWNNNPGQTNGEGTGGGFSTVFPLPAWQAPYFDGATGRVVPDLAANADPTTGYRIWLGGAPVIVGGTSAVAPMMAGLIAACGPKRGWIGEKLWQNPAAFQQWIFGNNGLYAQPPNPGPCSGLGRPLGGAFTEILLNT